MRRHIVVTSVAFFAIGNGAVSVVASNEVVGPSAAPMPRSQAHGSVSPGTARSAGGDVPLGGTNEPTVAVNPTNPLNVVYASLFELRASNDGGTSFGPSVAAVVPFGFGQCGDASLAFDSQGRLFWTYLGCISGGIDLFIAQVDPTTGAVSPGYPVNVTDSPGVGLPGNSGLVHDKEWLAADSFAGSQFVDSLYIAWSEFGPEGVRVLTSFSRDQGVTWAPAVELSEPGEGFPWPVHTTVAPNGDVYVSYHSDAGGQVFVVRSVDGGETYPQKTRPYLPGQANFTFNVQNDGAPIPGTTFWLQGSAQAWIMADPNIEGRIYVVANDDPDDELGSGDPADVFIAISEDHGVTWSPPRRIDSGPGTTFQVMPTAAIDRDSGCIAVHYYDNRNANVNADGHFLLDVFATTSVDGGLTFAPDFQINDVPFDPDPGAPVRFTGPPPTTRIGEYNGVAVGGGLAHAVWCGNRVNGFGDPTGQQTISDAFVCVECTPVECDDGDPCNGAEACDPDNGLCLRTLTDCNENENDDVCDVSECDGDPACSDCNANGAPDRCDLFTFYVAASDVLSGISFTSPQDFILESPPVAAGDVTFSFTASADVGEPFLGIDVIVNGVPIGTVFGSNGHFCPIIPDTAELTMSADDFNPLRVFGPVGIAMIPTAGVDACQASFITVTVRYETQVAPDCNENGVPDECEPDCQPNDVPDQCDIVSGTSADANENGVPDECECQSNAACNQSGVCEFGRCVDGICLVIPADYGDVVGEGGACGPDGRIDLSDILAVLDGFAGTFRDGCERVNMDIAGTAGSCVPDDVIGLSDILNVLDAFQGLDRCCSGRR